jgi:RNA polymerase sigma factor (sigma-70 family)
LGGAIGQVSFDSTVSWFEPAQSQLRRQIVHHSFFCAMLVSKPAPNRIGPVFVQPPNIKFGEARAAGQVILHLFHALVLQECVQDRPGIARILLKCLTKLSPPHREIIDLVYYQGKSIDEVAEITGVPQNTVKTRMFYARKRIAELMSAQGIDRAII